eukprot:g1076.t1
MEDENIKDTNNLDSIAVDGKERGVNVRHGAEMGSENFFEQLTIAGEDEEKISMNNFEIDIENDTTSTTSVAGSSSSFTHISSSPSLGKSLRSNSNSSLKKISSSESFDSSVESELFTKQTKNGILKASPRTTQAMSVLAEATKKLEEVDSIFAKLRSLSEEKEETGTATARFTAQLRRELNYVALHAKRWRERCLQAEQKCVRLASNILETKEYAKKLGMSLERERVEAGMERGKLLMGRIIAHLKRTKRSAAFNKWYTEALISRSDDRERELALYKIIAVISRLQHHVYLKSWNRWAGFSHCLVESNEAKRNACFTIRRILSHIQHRQLSLAFRSWYVFVLATVAEEEAKASALIQTNTIIRHLQHRQLSTGWRQWNGSVRRYREAMLMKNHQSHIENMSNREEELKKQHALLLMSKVVSKVLKAALSRGYYTWYMKWWTIKRKEGCHEKAAQKISRVIRRMEFSFCAKAMNAWILMVREAHLQLSLDAVGDAESSLEEQSMKHKLQLLNKVVGRLQHAQLAAGFWSFNAVVQAWRREEALEAVQQKHAIEVLNRIVHHLRHRHLSVGWRQWRDCVQRYLDAMQLQTYHDHIEDMSNREEKLKKDHALRLMSKVFATVLKAALSCGFRSWYGFVLATVAEEEAKASALIQTNTIIRHLQHRQLSTGWRQWNGSVRRYREAMLMKNHQSHIENMSNREEELKKQHALLLMSKVVSKVLKAALSRGYYTWYMKWWTIKRKEGCHEKAAQKISRVIRRMEFSFCAKAMNEWTNLVKWQRHQSLQYDIAGLKLAAGTTEKQHKLHLLAKVAGRFHHTKLATSFWTMNMNVQNRKRVEALKASLERHALEVMNQAIQRIQYGHISRGFRSWHVYTLSLLTKEEAKASALIQMNTIIRHLQHRQLSIGWRMWHSNFRKEKSIYMALQWSSRLSSSERKRAIDAIYRIRQRCVYVKLFRFFKKWEGYIIEMKVGHTLSFMNQEVAKLKFERNSKTKRIEVLLEDLESESNMKSDAQILAAIKETARLRDAYSKLQDEVTLKLSPKEKKCVS